MPRKADSSSFIPRGRSMASACASPSLNDWNPANPRRDPGAADREDVRQREVLRSVVRARIAADTRERRQGCAALATRPAR